MKRPTTIHEVIAEVAKTCDMPPDMLTLPTRRTDISYPRQAAAYIAFHIVPNATTTKIARSLGYSEHSTVCYACNAIKQKHGRKRRDIVAATYRRWRQE